MGRVTSGSAQARSVVAPSHIAIHERDRRWPFNSSFPGACPARAHCGSALVIMATRGHVQDPNDRRLRPIYGECLGPAWSLARHAEAWPAGGGGPGGALRRRARGVRARGRAARASRPHPRPCVGAGLASWAPRWERALGRAAGRSAKPVLTGRPWATRVFRQAPRCRRAA